MLEKLLQMGVVELAGLVVVEQDALSRFAEIVKAARSGYGYSQSEFGKFLGFSQSTINNWENAKTVPDIEGIEKIAKLRGQFPEELLAEIYNRKTEASIQERIEMMGNQELAWLMMLISQRMSKL